MMRLWTPLAVIVMLGVIVCCSQAPARTWTDSTGKHKIEGEFVKLADGQVDIRRDDGKLVRIRLDKLSEDDQKYARQSARPAAEVTPLAVTVSEDKPAIIPQSPGDAKDTQTVFAEGVGTTKEEALKDAFRAAVRQVVGEVVDGETLIKNEQLVKDQVLTYSDGFIPEHSVTSEKRDNGLFRVGIEAKVQRRGIIMKLKAANITLKSFDGESLYGSVVTQEEAKANATQLLRKALADLPTMLTAEMVGKPTYDSDQGEVVLQISIKPDRKAFDPFRERLEEVLKKVAQRHEFIVMHSKTVHGGGRGVSDEGKTDLALPTWFQKNNDPASAQGREISGPGGRRIRVPAQEPILWPWLGSKDQWCIALCSFNDASHTTTRWDIYVLDADPIKSLCDLFGQTRLILSMSDSAGGIVTEDQLVLGKMTWQNHMPMDFLRGTLDNDLNWCHKGVRSAMVAGPHFVPHKGHNKEPEQHWLFVAPYCLCSSSHLLVHAPECKLERHIKLTLDELNRVTDVRCKVVFRATSGN